MSSTAGPESVCTTGLCFETRTNAGSSWKVASSTAAATAAPRTTSRHFRLSFVSTTYAVERKMNTPTSETPTETAVAKTTLSPIAV
jgi:hypothetical protein